MKQKCCICGRNINFMNTYHRTYHQHSYNLCMFCVEAFEQIDSGKQSKVELGRKHLRAEYAKGQTVPEAIPMLKETLGEKLEEEIERGMTDASNQVGDVPVVSSGVPLLTGIIFLALAVILYFVSVNNNYGVANIQSTVYSAASFVAAIVCFAASRIINAVNSK